MLHSIFRSSSSARADDWSYSGATGPQFWGFPYPVCGRGTQQSPIDINTLTLVPYLLFPPLVLNDRFSLPVAMEMENNGHGVDINFKNPSGLYISGAGLSGLYQADGFHLHWGADSRRGSEHSINSIRFPLELHLVTFNTKYLTLTSALNFPDGLAVFSVLFTVSPVDNPALTPIVSKLPFVTLPDTDVDLDPMTLTSLLPGDLSAFYRYQGSLTTPECQESVTWTVFR